MKATVVGVGITTAQRGCVPLETFQAVRDARSRYIPSIRGKLNVLNAKIRHSVACAAAVRVEDEVPAMPEFLDSIKWDSNNLAVAIAQHIDTGEVLMQAFVDRNAVNETLQTGYVVL